MADSVFRSPVTQAPATPHIQSKSDPTTVKGDTIEVPYMDYEAEHGKPFVVDLFQLGDRWQESDGGFTREVATIQNYITEKIKTGDLANSQTAVKEMLRGMEKLNNLTKEERTVVKLEVLTHYIEFLQKNDQTKRNLRRYNAY